MLKILKTTFTANIATVVNTITLILACYYLIHIFKICNYFCQEQKDNKRLEFVQPIKQVIKSLKWNYNL